MPRVRLVLALLLGAALLIAPSAAIGLTILALNTLGDGLRDALDPRLRA